MAREPGFRTFSLMARDRGLPFATLRQAAERIRTAIPQARVEEEEAVGTIVLHLPEDAEGQATALVGNDLRLSASQPLQSGPATPRPFPVPQQGGGKDQS
jgi:hypothetical protein